MKRLRYVQFALLTSLLFSQFAQAQESLKYFDDFAVRRGLAGFSVALGDGVGFAGAPSLTSQAGLGYLFNTQSGATSYFVEPSVHPSDSMFGFNSQLVDNYLIVSDPANPFDANPDAGAAYVIDVTTGQELRRLQPTDSFGGDEFGFGVNLYGTTAAIGAPHIGVGVGAAYLFDVSTGVELHKLTPDQPVAGSEFGADTALGPQHAVIGAPMNYGTLGEVPGLAYVFDVETGLQRFKLEPNDSFAGDEFGFDVAVYEDVAVVGAPNGGSGVGAAYVFDLTTGLQLMKLQPDVQTVDDDFGATVDIEKNVVAVGASGLGQINGAVYLFDAMTGMQLGVITPSDLESHDAFGISVALHGTQLLVGSPQEDSLDVDEGAAYLFDLEPSLFGLTGDFNQNARLDVGDIDLLTRAVFDGDMDTKFDLNDDGSVGHEDRAIWINEIFGSYVGDANLDGEFNTEDFVDMFIAGEYLDGIGNNSSWATGDFDGDLDFTSEDFVVAFVGGGYLQGPRAVVVPEPSLLALVLGWGPWLLCRWRREH